MKKRMFSFLLVLICVCSFSLSAFAKDIDDITADDAAQIVANPYLWYAQNQMLGVEKGTGVTLVCPNGDYKTLYTGGTLVTCPYDGEALELASAGGVTAKKIPEGIGRKDIIGYQDNNGTPSVNQSGLLNLFIPVTGWQTNYRSGGFLTASPDVGDYIPGKDLSFTNSTSPIYVPLCSIEAPISGLYSYTADESFPVANGRLYNTKWVSFHYNFPSKAKAYDKGSTIYFLATNISTSAFLSGYPLVLDGYGINVTVEPLGESRVTNYNKITINNNNWNGNIYVDSSTNLTYIYPEYTTINENNETVTNISTNPIIYNSETKQYYTYDSVTQNYYYITYNENSATPTPSPSPTPNPDTPDATPTPNPDIPTPTPKPSGDSDSNNGGGSSWNPFKWLTDLLKDIVETILKGLWKLLTSIFGFILWLLSLLFKLFPWMPNSGILALCAGVVVVTVIRIIKFITGR